MKIKEMDMRIILFVCITLLIASTSPAFAKSNTIPDVNNPVVGLLGASFVDPEASPFNTVGLTSLNGSSYRGLADFMKAQSIHNPRGIVYRESAEGGATTDGSHGFLSVQEQAERLVEHTTAWVDGTHMKIAVIFRFNDCVHSVAGLCNREDVLNRPVANTIAAIQYLQSQGVKVVVPYLLDYDDMDLPLVEEVFSQIVPGFKVATEEQYLLYKETFEAEIEKLPGVVMLDLWSGMTHIGDGLHPDHRSKKRAARKLHHRLKSILRAQ